MNVDDELPPIDGQALSSYIRTGRQHFDRVGRSWRVFWLNANELLGLLHSVETNALASLQLMQDPTPDKPDLSEFHQRFWDGLDQRLHNMVASAASLIDHTRPLIDFYEHSPEFQAEFTKRNEAVARSPRASFLRRLRNYLLHYGMAPLMQTMSLAATTTDEWDHLRIKLAGNALLAWDGWNEVQREFISSFDGGPPLSDVFNAYCEDMRDVYGWLFGQYKELHVPGVVPAHLAEGRANRIVY